MIMNDPVDNNVFGEILIKIVTLRLPPQMFSGMSCMMNV